MENNNRFMKILIIEDDSEECQNFIKCIENRNDIKLVGITDSDIEGLRCVKISRPDAIVLDIELANSKSGNMTSLDFLKQLKELIPNYKPIIVVITHVKSSRTHEIFHRNGADMILYKGHPAYSCNHVLNTVLSLKIDDSESPLNNMLEVIADDKRAISQYVDFELDNIGIKNTLKGREYLYDAIVYLVENRDKPGNEINHTQYLVKKHHISDKTIANGMRTAILYAWNHSSLETLTKYYTATINSETGFPTTTEFIYYYFKKIKNKI